MPRRYLRRTGSQRLAEADKLDDLYAAVIAKRDGAASGNPKDGTAAGDDRRP